MFFIIVVVFFVVVAFKAPKSTRKLPDDGPSDGELGVGFHLTTGYAYVNVFLVLIEFMYEPRLMI